MRTIRLYTECRSCNWTLMCLLAAVLCFLSVAVKAADASPGTIFNAANAHYKAARFDKAIAGYEEILAAGYRNAEVYYNLGNAYYKLNDQGKAILNYERGLKLAPEDEDIQHNLKLANLNIPDKIRPVPQLAVITWWKGFTASQSSKGWAWYALGAIWLTMIAFAAYLFAGRKKAPAFAGAVFLLFSIAFISLAFKQSSAENNSTEGVLLVSETFVKSAPDANSVNVFQIHEGVKFTLLDRVSTWNKIRLADGKVGWLEDGSFEKI